MSIPVQLVGAELHDGVQLAPYVNLYGCAIGRETRIGAFAEIQDGVRVGERCKISSHSFLCSGLEIRDEVFVGHGVQFCNDRYPQATRADGRPRERGDWQQKSIYVESHVSIGSGAVILPGISIGRGATVGAGAVVVCAVAPGATVVGVPARPIRSRKKP